MFCGNLTSEVGRVKVSKRKSKKSLCSAFECYTLHGHFWKKITRIFSDSLDLPQTNQVNPFRLASNETRFQALRNDIGSQETIPFDNMWNSIKIIRTSKRSLHNITVSAFAEKQQSFFFYYKSFNAYS